MNKLAFALTFCLLFLPSRGDVSILDVIPILHKIPGVKIVGWDQVAGLNEKLSDSGDAVSSFKQINLLDITNQIVAKTAYKSISIEDSVVILPKDDNSKYNTPISRRMLMVPAISNKSIYEALRQISDSNGPHFLLIGNRSLVPIIRGKVSLNSGNYMCYDILNRIAKQVKAKSWIINNGASLDSQGKALYPIRLDSAQVTFFQ